VLVAIQIRLDCVLVFLVVQAVGVALVQVLALEQAVLLLLGKATLVEMDLTMEQAAHRAAAAEVLALLAEMALLYPLVVTVVLV
jgi:hypothetical protein